MAIQLMVQNPLGLLLDDSIELTIEDTDCFSHIENMTQRVLAGYGYYGSKIQSLIELDDGELDEIPASLLSGNSPVSGYCRAIVTLPLAS